MSRVHPGGRHELGQNHLVDRAAIDAVVRAVAATTGPITEIGAGAGALTGPLTRLGRPITAIEIDPRRAPALARLPGVAVRVEDVLACRPPAAGVLVGNVPFSITTALLRRLLAAPGWTDAVLLVQWEVARRRAGVGGASLMTAEWWPWFTFAVLGRVPARAFRPVPQVDGGLLRIHRRAPPLLAVEERRRHRELVGRVFRSPGRGVGEMAVRAGVDRAAVQRWRREHGVPATALPRALDAEQWAGLTRSVRAGRG